MIRTAAVTATLIGSVLVCAPAATASQEEYLRDLQPRYVYLTPQQLLDVGNKVCAAESNGTLAPDRTAMVQRELSVSTNTALEIVSAAEWNIC